MTRPEAKAAEAPQAAGILMLLAAPAAARLVTGALALFFVLTLPTLAMGGWQLLHSRHGRPPAGRRRRYNGPTT